MRKCKGCHIIKENKDFQVYDGKVKQKCEKCTKEKLQLKSKNKKRCVNCGEIKNFSEFHPFREVCKICHKKNGFLWATNNKSRRKTLNELCRRRSPERQILNRTKCRARKSGTEFNLELKDIIIPTKCPILDIDIFVCEGGMKDNSPSIDRIDNNKGYIKGNIQIISNRANRIKSDSSLEELEKLFYYMKSLDKK